MSDQAGRCSHCGRFVRATLHGKGGVVVDYYRSMIGTPHADLIDDPSGSGATLRIVRVEGLHEVLTCQDCWGSPSARAALVHAWRTGILRGEG